VPLTFSAATLIRPSRYAKTGVIPKPPWRPAELSGPAGMLGRCTCDVACRKTGQRIQRRVLSLKLHEHAL